MTGKLERKRSAHGFNVILRHLRGGIREACIRPACHSNVAFPELDAVLLLSTPCHSWGEGCSR